MSILQTFCGLTALVGGALVRSGKAALLVGLGVALVYTAVISLLLFAARDHFASIDWPAFLGTVTGTGLVFMILALLSNLVRRWLTGKPDPGVK
jgi:hypothetical protein